MPPAKPPVKSTSNFHASEKSGSAKPNVDKLAIDSTKPLGSARGQSSGRKATGTSGGSSDSFRKDGKRPDSARKPAESSIKTKSATPRAATRRASIKPSKDASKPLERPSQKPAEAEPSTEKKSDATANGSTPRATPRAAMASSTSKGGGMAAGTPAAAAKEKAEGKYPVRDDTAPSRHSIVNSWSTQNDPVLLFNCSGAACRYVMSPSRASHICMQVHDTVYARLFPSRWSRVVVSAGGAQPLTKSACLLCPALSRASIPYLATLRRVYSEPATQTPNP